MTKFDNSNNKINHLFINDSFFNAGDNILKQIKQKNKVYETENGTSLSKNFPTQFNLKKNKKIVLNNTASDNMLKIGKISKDINYKTMEERGYKINIKNQNYPIIKKDKLKKISPNIFQNIITKNQSLNKSNINKTNNKLFLSMNNINNYYSYINKLK